MITVLHKGGDGGNRLLGGTHSLSDQYRLGVFFPYPVAEQYSCRYTCIARSVHKLIVNLDIIGI